MNCIRSITTGTNRINANNFAICINGKIASNDGNYKVSIHNSEIANQNINKETSNLGVIVVSRKGEMR